MRTLTLLLLAALAACGEPAPPALQVADVSFTRDQLLGLSPSRKERLGQLTAFGLAVADSAIAALGGSLLDKRRNDRLLDILAAELTVEKAGVGDEALEARYLTDPEYELTVRHILFFSERWRSDAERAEAKAKAKRALEALKGGADFAETAARLSEEPGAEGREGLLTPGREGAWVDEFWNAAVALEVDEISPVTETQYGYHILRLEDRAVVPFQEARSTVVREVAQQMADPREAMQTWVDRAATSLDVDAEALASASNPDSLPPDTELATWEGGGLTLGEYLEWAAAQPASWDRGGLGGNAQLFENSVRQLARRKMALEEARRRGLAVPEAEAAEIRRAWDDLALRWATSLGFQQGMSHEDVARAALEALARTAQGATISREEIGRRAPLLRAHYDIRLPETPSPPPA